MHQRFPTYCRPLPFVAGAAALLVGLQGGLNWAWDWSLQTGNVFIQIGIPTRLISFEGLRLLYWLLAACGLVTFALFGMTGRRAARQAVENGINLFWRPLFRFHPLTFMLGLFLTYFGTVFLFNASVTGDDTPVGFVAFVYLNYAGIVRRGLISIIGLLILFAGLMLATSVAFRPGLGPIVAPTRAAARPTTSTVTPAEPVPAAAPAPSVIVPRPPPARRPALNGQATRTAPARPSTRPSPGATSPRPRRAPSTSRTS